MRNVLLVGNNWDGTADVINVRTYQRLRRINVVPDRAERMAEIMSRPDRLASFLLVREQIGEGHDQLVDDLYASKDGRFMYVSRPSFADVVAIELSTGEIAWRTMVEGQRADHMAISPDGKHLDRLRIDGMAHLPVPEETSHPRRRPPPARARRRLRNRSSGDG
jgi:hypothetical protein